MGRSPKSPEAIDTALVGLVDRVARRLRKGDRAGRTVVLRFRFNDFTRATRSHTLPRATDQTEVILATARVLLAGMWSVIVDQGLTLIGLAVANLDDGGIQLDLPFDRHSGTAIDAALDEVRLRFGPGAVTRAVLLGHDERLSVPLLPD